ncbi:MAG TPA: glucuronate isomerase [Ktedonobacteraceae bacterium]
MMQSEDERYFSSDAVQRSIAYGLYKQTRNLPLLCPHGHVDPRILAEESHTWGSPVDLLIIPDHYIFRMLYSQGISLEALGIPRRDEQPVEQDHRKIWQLFCDHWSLFRGTPTSLWLRDELREIFGIETKLTSASAQEIYTALTERLSQPEFQPRRLFERFHIEVLATTDPATADLHYHQQIRASGWQGRVIPTFRPDAVVNIQPGYAAQIERLGEVTGRAITSYRLYLAALEQQRSLFKSLGATATDHAAQSAYTERLSEQEAEAIFQRALRDEASAHDAQRFTGHMLIEMARMSVEDGLVMQLHVGSLRDHNPEIFAHFGRDMGADIPMASEFTHNLRPLLDLFGRERALTLILFNLDESTYGRELAPLAGHYPALRLGPPWWFFDSMQGMYRFLDNVAETAGLENLVGFNDDTRAYPSIPARHDLWRRVSADWVANLVVRRVVDEEDASAMVQDLAYGLAKQTYRLGA